MLLLGAGKLRILVLEIVTWCTPELSEIPLRFTDYNRNWCVFSEVLLGFPQSLQQRSRALIPHPGVLLPEGLAVPLEELGQHRVFAAI